MLLLFAFHPFKKYIRPRKMKRGGEGISLRLVAMGMGKKLYMYAIVVVELTAETAVFLYIGHHWWLYPLPLQEIVRIRNALLICSSISFLPFLSFPQKTNPNPTFLFSFSIKPMVFFSIILMERGRKVYK
jgi:hypothetical protein